MGISTYKLISFDMFQTLVDLGSQKENILRKIFLNRYDPDIGNKLWADADEYVYKYFHRLSNNNEPYMKTVDIFTQCYRMLFPKYNLKMSPEEGALILARAHNQAEMYPETKDVIKTIQKRFRTCIISDTDNIMIEELVDKVGIKTIYTSEDYQTYKFDKNGLLFKTAIRDYKIAPEEMLHVGDGVNDVLGASSVGSDTVWINRNHESWDQTVKPTYEITNLNQLLEDMI